MAPAAASSRAVNLTLADSVLKDNQAPRGSGGGISDAVNVSGLGLTIVNDLFEGNTAGSASVNVFSGDGGAIDAENGTVLSVSSSTFIDNQSISPEAEGGAISVIDNPFGFTPVHGSLTVTGSTFRGNVASSASSFGEGFVVGFYAAGGAIWADPQAGVTIGSSQFLSNEAELSDTLGNPGTVTGGAIEVTPVLTGSSATAQSPATITNSVFSGNLAVGTGNSGSTASGGAIDSGSFGFTDGAIITISGSTFAGNQAVGEDSSTNGRGGPGARRRDQHERNVPCPHLRRLLPQRGRGRLGIGPAGRTRRRNQQPVRLQSEHRVHDDDLR